jgi:hypothetical protein
MNFAAGKLVWILAGVSALVLLLWSGILFLLFTGPDKVTPTASEPAAVAVPDNRQTTSSGFVSQSPGVYEQEVSTYTPEPEPETAGADSGSDDAAPSWQGTINSILMDDAEPRVLSQRLAASLGTLPPEGQLEAAQHMVNLLADEEYVTAENIYFNPAMPVPVRRLVFEDFMNRPNALKLPLLVRTLRDMGNPMRQEAIDNLQVYIGRDEGEDWVRWDAAVRESLEKERREQESLQATGEQ